MVFPQCCTISLDICLRFSFSSRSLRILSSSICRLWSSCWIRFHSLFDRIVTSLMSVPLGRIIPLWPIFVPCICISAGKGISGVPVLYLMVIFTKHGIDCKLFHVYIANKIFYPIFGLWGLWKLTPCNWEIWLNFLYIWTGLRMAQMFIREDYET